MKKILLSFLLISLFGFVIFGQSSPLEVFIKVTDIDTLTDGTVWNFSTDDVEEENGAVVKLDDDDLDVGWEGAPVDQNLLSLGLRFRDIAIPQGATIDSAFITVHCHEGKGAGHVCILNISGEAADSAVTFDWTPPVTDRPRTSTSVEWSIEEEWIIWKPYSSPDLGEIIQEIVNRPGWKSGNAIALILEGQDQGITDTMENAREFMSFENIQDPSDVDPDGVQGDGKNHPDKVPKLMIYSALVSVPEINGSQPVFDVYPNPTEGILNISVKSDRISRIQIFNAMGQLVRSTEVTSQSFSLDVSDLKGGLYILRAVAQNKMFTQKVILR
jgi:hypothetical protein